MSTFLSADPATSALCYVEGPERTDCAHPVDDHAPLSGGEWCCGHCGQLVEHPLPYVADPLADFFASYPGQR